MHCGRTKEFLCQTTTFVDANERHRGCQRAASSCNERHRKSVSLKNTFTNQRPMGSEGQSAPASFGARCFWRPTIGCAGHERQRALPLQQVDGVAALAQRLLASRGPVPYGICTLSKRRQRCACAQLARSHTGWQFSQKSARGARSGPLVALS